MCACVCACACIFACLNGFGREGAGCERWGLHWVTSTPGTLIQVVWHKTFLNTRTCVRACVRACMCVLFIASICFYLSLIFSFCLFLTFRRSRIGFSIIIVALLVQLLPNKCLFMFINTFLFWSNEIFFIGFFIVDILWLKVTENVEVICVWERGRRCWRRCRCPYKVFVFVFADFFWLHLFCVQLVWKQKQTKNECFEREKRFFVRI